MKCVLVSKLLVFIPAFVRINNLTMTFPTIGSFYVLILYRYVLLCDIVQICAIPPYWSLGVVSGDRVH